MKVKLVYLTFVLMLLGFVLIPVDAGFAVPATSGDTSMDGTAQTTSPPSKATPQEDQPPQPPRGVSPIRPEIKRPLPQSQCSCGCCCCRGQTGQIKPRGKQLRLSPHLGSRLGEARKLRTHGRDGRSERKIFHRRFPRQKARHGKARLHGRGITADRLLLHASELGLTEDQITKLKALAFSTKKELIDLRAALQKERLELGKLLREEDPNVNLIKKQLDASARAQVNLKFKLISAKIDAGNILTKEQRELIKEKMHKHMMGGHGDLFGMGKSIEEFCDVTMTEHLEGFIDDFGDEHEVYFIEETEIDE